MPDAVPGLAPVLRLADRAVTGTEKSGNYRFFLFCKGLAEYRAGRNAEAGELGGAIGTFDDLWTAKLRLRPAA